VPAGRIGWAFASFSGVEGGSTALEFVRTGGSTGAVSIAVEVVAVTASAADLSYSNERITWADGDAQPKSMVIDWLPDGADEGMEEVIVRLVDPRGGATLNRVDRASVFVSEPARTAELALRDSAVEVIESGPGLAVVTVQRRGSAAGPVSVDYLVTPVSATRGTDFDGPESGTLSWAAGDALPQSIEFSILNDPDTELTETFSLTLQNALGADIPGPAVATVSIIDGSAANTPPVASAGADQVRASGSNVMLNGGGSFDPDGDALSYQWVQVSGAAVSLGGATSESATFVAPTVTSDTQLTFEVVVTDDRGSSNAAETSVSVTPGRDSRGGSGAPGPWLLLGLLLSLTLRAAGQSTPRRLRQAVASRKGSA